MKVMFKGFDVPKTFKTYNQVQSFIQALVIVGVIAFVVDYVTLPAYNLHDIGFLTLLVVYLFIFGTLYSSFSHRFDFVVKAVYSLGILLFHYRFLILLKQHFSNRLK